MSARSLIEQYGKATRVERPTFATGTGGAQIQTFGLVTTETIWIQPTSADTRRMYGAEYEEVTNDGYVRYGSPVRKGDELEQTGQRYRVLGRFNAGNMSKANVAHQILALSFTTGVT